MNKQHKNQWRINALVGEGNKPVGGPETPLRRWLSPVTGFLPLFPGWVTTWTGPGRLRVRVGDMLVEEGLGKSGWLLPIVCSRVSAAASVSGLGSGGVAIRTCGADEVEGVDALLDVSGVL